MQYLLTAVQLFSAAASRLTAPLATLVTGGAKGLVASTVLLGDPDSGRSQLLGLLGASAETAFPLLPQQGGEAITIYQGDCTSPATDFDLQSLLISRAQNQPDSS